MRLTLITLCAILMLSGCGGGSSGSSPQSAKKSSASSSLTSSSSLSSSSEASSVQQSSSSSEANNNGANTGACPNGRRIVGYFPSWQGSVVDIQYDYLTHINYSFVLPQPDGQLIPMSTADENELMELVTLAHGHSVKVGIAVGGWNDGDDSGFVALAKDASKRAVFVQAMVDFVERYQLDGIDVDWEYPSTNAQADDYLLLMQELRLALDGLTRDQFLTAAVVAQGDWNGKYILDGVFDEIDFLNIMAYDEYGALSHSSMDYAETSLAYWANRGLPRAKTVLGNPFYARPNYVSYREYVAMDIANACKDNVGNNYYNGIPTMRAKAELANTHACGVMMWDLSQDTSDQSSLLKALWEVSEGVPPSYICPE